LVDAGTTEEERFWAFYKLSDSGHVHKLV